MLGQLIPEGVLVTDPPPLGEIVTWRVGFATKVAVTDVAADIVTLQVLVPVQPPLQPVKVYPLPAVAVSVT